MEVICKAAAAGIECRGAKLPMSSLDRQHHFPYLAQNRAPTGAVFLLENPCRRRQSRKFLALKV